MEGVKKEGCKERMKGLKKGGVVMREVGEGFLSIVSSVTCVICVGISVLISLLGCSNADCYS